ncbi:MAG: hypothetical protein JWR90_2615, partial [Marmoricola sp.]|nr:hypothetical protein [Marmoricola sp.]
AFAASLAAQSRLQAAEVAATARKGTAEIQVPSQRDRVDQEIVSA